MVLTPFHGFTVASFQATEHRQSGVCPFEPLRWAGSLQNDPRQGAVAFAFLSKPGPKHLGLKTSRPKHGTLKAPSRQPLVWPDCRRSYCQWKILVQRRIRSKTVSGNGISTWIHGEELAAMKHMSRMHTRLFVILGAVQIDSRLDAEKYRAANWAEHNFI